MASWELAPHLHSHCSHSSALASKVIPEGKGKPAYGTAEQVGLLRGCRLPGGGVCEGRPIRPEGPAQEKATGSTVEGGQWE